MSKPTKNPGGRPPISAGQTQPRRNISLSDELADIARELGDGNLSAGIRAAIITATDNNPIDPAAVWAAAELMGGAQSCITQATTLLAGAATKKPPENQQ